MPDPDSPTILYVDDEPINLRVFDANFRHRFRIVTCGSGKDALEILKARANEIGVLISDQRMPEMSGVEVLEKAREIAPDVQRMLLTAYSDMQAVVDAVNRGQVARYFVKPWNKEELQAALDDALRIHQLQGKVREMEGRILQSERLATLGQVSSGIAHELMNPVSYISQNVGVLRTEIKLLEEYIRPKLAQQPHAEVKRTLDDLPQLVSDVETGVKHILQIAHGLRAQARGEDHEKFSDLAEVATFASKLARAEVRSRARLTLTGAPVRVAGGPVRLCQVLLNLVVNAAHSLDNVDRSGVIEVKWTEKESMVALTVSDNGCGIKPENLERVFNPLFTTKAVGKGTGLGLAICRDLVRGMGGQISLTSEVNVGTTVELKLQKYDG